MYIDIDQTEIGKPDIYLEVGYEFAIDKPEASGSVSHASRFGRWRPPIAGAPLKHALTNYNIIVYILYRNI